MLKDNFNPAEKNRLDTIEIFIDRRSGGREEFILLSFSNEDGDIIQKFFRLTVAVTVLVLLFCGFYKVWERSQVLQLSFTYDRLLRETERLERKNRKLQLKLSTLLSPARLYRLGKKLGLGPPKPAQLVNWKTVKLLIKSEKNSKRLAKVIEKK